jgi:hypothetical protein
MTVLDNEALRLIQVDSNDSGGPAKPESRDFSTCDSSPGLQLCYRMLMNLLLFGVPPCVDQTAVFLSIRLRVLGKIDPVQSVAHIVLHPGGVFRNVSVRLQLIGAIPSPRIHRRFNLLIAITNFSSTCT